jgi:ELWxxDGT repeat protein
MGPWILFVASDAAHGRELWRTDGTASGTVRVSDVAPGPDGGVPSSDRPDLWVVGQTVFFVGDERSLGWELWRSDGTPEGTAMVKDIAPGRDSSLSTMEAAVMDGVLYFRADDGTGYRLWRTDGTEAGTWSFGILLPDLRPSLTPWRGLLLFSGGEPSSTLNQLWRTDGTLSGTYLVKDVGVSDLVALESAALFAGTAGTNLQRELWTTDGSPEGTALLKDIRPGAPESRPEGFGACSGLLYFAADDGTHGRELWRSDNTPEGTVLLGDISPGPGNGLPGSYYGRGDLVLRVGDRIYFGATDGSSGEELWAYRLPGAP